jgi:hypothetical protein
VSNITCYHCFRTFEARQLVFKCVMHPEGPHLFAWKPRFWQRQPPRFATCPRDHLLTGYRVCPFPDCHQDLPYYAGRVRQRVIAVTGCSGTGKTLYLWSLIHTLQEDSARQQRPHAVALFENDDAFLTFDQLNRRILLDGELPDPTQAEEMRQGLARPCIVRILREGGRGPGLCNLIFYDPAGELFENLEEAQYLRYLAGSEAILYLVDLPRTDNPAEADQYRRKTSMGLNAVIHQIRNERGLARDALLDQPLAVALTKADENVLAEDAPGSWVAGLEQGGEFWRSWSSPAKRAVQQVSQRCEAFLREQELDSFVNLARMNFPRVCFFALSSLGMAPEGNRLTGRPQPVGVENPLFWILQTLS